MSETIRILVSPRKGVQVPVLERRGQFALHANLLPFRKDRPVEEQPVKLSAAAWTVTHVPTGRALAYAMHSREMAEVLLGFAHEQAPEGTDPNHCEALIRAAKWAQAGMLAPGGKV